MVEATWAKSAVEVAAVVVAFTPVKFWRVEEPEAKMVESEVAPETVSEVSVPILVRDERVATEEEI